MRTLRLSVDYGCGAKWDKIIVVIKQFRNKIKLRPWWTHVVHHMNYILLRLAFIQAIGRQCLKLIALLK